VISVHCAARFGIFSTHYSCDNAALYCRR